jgi:hypothetical protein
MLFDLWHNRVASKVHSASCRHPLQPRLVQNPGLTPIAMPPFRPCFQQPQPSFAHPNKRRGFYFVASSSLISTIYCILTPKTTLDVTVNLLLQQNFLSTVELCHALGVLIAWVADGSIVCCGLLGGLVILTVAGNQGQGTT